MARRVGVQCFESVEHSCDKLCLGEYVGGFLERSMESTNGSDPFRRGCATLRERGLSEPSSGSTPGHLDTWPFWAQQSVESAAGAVRSATALQNTDHDENSEDFRSLKRSEVQATMTSVSACAFTFDGLYSAVLARSSIDPATRDAWESNRTKRWSRVFEVLKRNFELGSHVDELGEALRTFFAFRDAAVHPPTEFEDPVYDPEFDRGVAPLLLRFRAENAKRARSTEIGILQHLFANPQRRDQGKTSKNGRRHRHRKSTHFLRPGAVTLGRTLLATRSGRRLTVTLCLQTVGAVVRWRSEPFTRMSAPARRTHRTV